MYCVKDQRDVAFCTCPDIHERMGQVASHPNLLVAPLAVVSKGKLDRPVFPTKLQPVFTPEREIRGMTLVTTTSGSKYRFESRDGKTYLRTYEPSGSSDVERELLENQAVVFSEFPIEAGYRLCLRLENGAYVTSTPIKQVDLEVEEI